MLAAVIKVVLAHKFVVSCTSFLPSPPMRATAKSPIIYIYLFFILKKGCGWMLHGLCFMVPVSCGARGRGCQREMGVRCQAEAPCWGICLISIQDGWRKEEKGWMAVQEANYAIWKEMVELSASQNLSISVRKRKRCSGIVSKHLDSHLTLIVYMNITN